MNQQTEKNSSWQAVAQLGDHNVRKGRQMIPRVIRYCGFRKKKLLDIIPGPLFDKRSHMCLMETITKDTILHF